MLFYDFCLFFTHFFQGPTKGDDVVPGTVYPVMKTARSLLHKLVKPSACCTEHTVRRSYGFTVKCIVALADLTVVNLLLADRWS